MPGPLPRRLLWCFCPFLPKGLQPSPHYDRVGVFSRHSVRATSRTTPFRSCRHSLMFRPPSLLPPRSLRPIQPLPYGRHGVYLRASYSSSPPCTSDMLTVRTGQLTVRGLAPLKICSIVGCSAFLPLQLSGILSLFRERHRASRVAV